ncbi:hypothetical protein A2U01_0073688, partial [Trifolium medium]|nr:hypothetical protein [Trifolium medium]
VLILAQRAVLFWFSSGSCAACRGALRCVQSCSVRAGGFLVPARRAGWCSATRRA